MPPMLTIVSADGGHRAIVSETDDGVAVAFYRLVHDESRGKPLSEQQNARKWRYVRTSIIPQPFHVGLDIAHDVVNAQ
jgi:hypothetical protein